MIAKLCFSECFANLHIRQPTKGIQAVNCVMHIKPSCSMRQDESHPWVFGAVLPDSRLIASITECSLSHHVQCYGESVVVSSCNKMLRKVPIFNTTTSGYIFNQLWAIVNTHADIGASKVQAWWTAGSAKQ